MYGKKSGGYKMPTKTANNAARPTTLKTTVKKKPVSKMKAYK